MLFWLLALSGAVLLWPRNGSFGQEPDIQSGSVTIHWTAPGDDAQTGTAKAYEFRFKRGSSFRVITKNPDGTCVDDFSTGELIGAVANAATPYGAIPLPLPSGTRQEITIQGLPTTGTIYIAMKAVDEAGNWACVSDSYMLDWTTETLPTPTPTPGEPQARVTYELGLRAPFPNPTNKGATFSFVPPAYPAILRMYDPNGRKVWESSTIQAPSGGSQELMHLAWEGKSSDGRKLPAGVYFLRLQTSSPNSSGANKRISFVQKLVIMR
jgi:hypothetical protein